MRRTERLQNILKLLRLSERLSIEELAHSLSISKETIRRDVNELTTKGQVIKFHGGAALALTDDRENAFQIRMDEHAPEKLAVARHAVGLFAPGDSIFIDTGTTTLFFARELSKLSTSRITVITNSLSIAEAIGSVDNRVFTVGGEYQPESRQNLGALAVEQISRFNAEHAVLTIGALGVNGAMDFSCDEAEIAKAMISQARHITVIADSSKLNRRALFNVAPLERINRLVVDRKPEGALWDALIKARVEVLEASAL